MASEAGHAATRVYNAQDGSFHLNGAAFFNDAEVDISGSLETALGGSSGGQKLVGGVVTNSTTGVQTIATVLSGIIAAWATPISTAISTAAGIPAYCKVGYTTNSSNLDVLSIKNSATAIDTIAATSSGVSISWAALGYI